MLFRCLDNTRKLNAQTQTTENTKQKNNTDSDDGVQYLSRGNNTSIKQQVIDNLDSLNSMDIVVSYDVNYRFNGLQETKQWAVDQLNILLLRLSVIADITKKKPHSSSMLKALM